MDWTNGPLDFFLDYFLDHFLDHFFYRLSILGEGWVSSYHHLCWEGWVGRRGENSIHQVVTTVRKTLTGIVPVELIEYVERHC